MATFDDLEKAIKTNLLICFCDLHGFRWLARDKADPMALYEAMNGMAVTIIRAVKNTTGRLIKFIGDEAMIVFPEEDVDESMRMLLDLKPEVETYFRGVGFEAKMQFGVHFGEVVIGPYGEDPYCSIDVFGDHVNTAAKLVYGEKRGKFVITPQAFRKLKPETRKRFHKFTPPVTYIA